MLSVCSILKCCRVKDFWIAGYFTGYLVKGDVKACAERLFPRLICVLTSGRHFASNSLEKKVLNRDLITTELQFCKYSSKMQDLIKSECDPMEYRLLQLDNGLRVLLVSDVQNIVEIEDLSDSESGSDTDSQASNTESEASKTESEESDFSGRTEESENDDKVSISVSKLGKEKMAACALSVGAGSFSDPLDAQGLAHFLEHMVFMGSEKYPQENGFDEFVKKRGGSNNGATDCEMTTFYVESNEQHLREAMDRFAQFFISPLLRREAMTRERESIQSEFDMTLPSDESRRWQLLGSLAPAGHPAAKFSWGNSVTLRDNIDDDTLFEKIHQFRRRYYSAHRMTLAVQGRLPLDTLEEYVRDSFSDIPNNGLPADDFTSYCNTFGNPVDFNKLIWVKPVSEISQLNFTWVLPSYMKEYMSRPLDQVAWLIEQEGRGSLMSFLSKKIWCLDCEAGNEENGFEYNSIYSLFSINFTLTEEGFYNISEVIGALFSYLAMLREQYPNKALFDEMDSIASSGFRYKSELSSSEYVEILAESMQVYEPNHYIAGGELYLEYKPELITEILSLLTPDKVNIIIYSNSKDDAFYDKVEPWFQTLYRIEDIPQKWMKSWENCKPMPNFHLPDPNPYVANNFDMLEKPENHPPYPEKIIDDGILEIWYRQDIKFNRPVSYYSLYIVSPTMQENALNNALLDLLTAYFDLKFIGAVYPANQAGLFSVIAPGNIGLHMFFNGFSQKLSLFFEEVLRLMAKHMKRIKSEDNRALIEALIKERFRSHFNRALRPEKLVKMTRLALLVNRAWYPIHYLDQMQYVTVDKLHDFAQEFFSQIRIVGLVQGNISKSDALEVCNKVYTFFNLRRIEGPKPVMEVAKLNVGEKYIRMKSFDNTSSNSVITNYYQEGPSTIRGSCLLSLLLTFMEEPLFNSLRTRQQIGYDVESSLRDTFGVLGFSIRVSFQSYKFNADEVDDKIEKFLQELLYILRDLPKKDLDIAKKTLCNLKSHADLDLAEEVRRNFVEICSGEFMFDRIEREIKLVQEITHRELCTWYENIIRGGANFRKLSIQVVGPSNPGAEDEVHDYNIHYLASDGERRNDFILDVEEFKSRREFFPNAKCT